MLITTQTDAYGGAYLTIHTDHPRPSMEVPVEQLGETDRFVCSYRAEPFFMTAKAGPVSQGIPPETQWLGLRHSDGSYSVYFSMAFERYRTSFFSRDGQLWLAAVTGDEAVKDPSFCGYYKLSGGDFYTLVETAARSIAEKLGAYRLRTEKKAPDFMDDFGWCTWDSFYDRVTAEDIRRGLASFQAGGMVPRLLILDDGWQTTAHHQLPRGQWKLSAFRENEKFAPSLWQTVEEAKARGVEKFLVWHAILGYWGGVDPESEEMEKYGPVLSRAVHTEQLRQVNPTRWESEHFEFGMIDPDRAAQFYDDYHAYLKSQGVDGVKVDVQSAMEAHGEGRGGRVRLCRTIREGLEQSVKRHFDGGMINCMSHSNDMVYHCLHSNLMRSSDDFFPNDPLSHSQHIYRNAVNSIWLGQIVWCDWDMFQTSHPYGAYHAAARVLSGGPVYVSDRVDDHDFSLIRSLTDSSGKILRAKGVGLPTADCLFADPRPGKGLYKIFNHNACGSMVGVFSFGGPAKSIPVSAADVPGNGPGEYALYSHKTGRAWVLPWEGSLEVTLEGTEFDIITICKVENGVAVLGLTDKLNCGGAVEEVTSDENGCWVRLADGGSLLVYRENCGFQTVSVPRAGQIRIP